MSQSIDAKRTRPDMKDYGISPDPQGMLAWEWVDAQMEKSRNYWIASASIDGKPHAAPVWGVWMDGALYFSTSPTSRKARNLSANPDVLVHLESGDDVVILEGRIEHERDLVVLRRMADRYGEKYPGFKPEPKEGDLWFRLHPRVALAWREHDFPTSATRWEL